MRASCQTKYFAQTNDIESQSGYASGVAAGLLMKDEGRHEGRVHHRPAGHLHDQLRQGLGSGHQVAGARRATVVTTYTGDFDKSDLGGRGVQRA